MASKATSILALGAKALASGCTALGKGSNLPLSAAAAAVTPRPLSALLPYRPFSSAPATAPATKDQLDRDSAAQDESTRRDHSGASTSTSSSSSSTAAPAAASPTTYIRSSTAARTAKRWLGLVWVPEAVGHALEDLAREHYGGRLE
jgi:hypothetical protein